MNSLSYLFSRPLAIFLLLGFLGLVNSGAGAQSSGGQKDFRAALTQFPAAVVKVLKRFKLPRKSLSVYVQDISESAPLLTVNAQTPRNPASVMKLVTTLVSLQELGPGYRFRTEIHADGPIDKNGRLKGNLYLRGEGDPSLTTEVFWRLLENLRNTGLRHISGDLIIDNSYFDINPPARGAFDRRPYRAYNVEPQATLINFHATAFRLYADPDNKRVRVLADPPMATLKIRNSLKLVKQRCNYRYRKINLQVTRTGPQPEVRFVGKFPARCRSQEILRAVADPTPYIFGVFKSLWERTGGSIKGAGRIGVVPEAARMLHRNHSRPLAEILRTINKFSNNVMARNLLLSLGAQVFKPPGTLGKGRLAIQDWMLAHHIMATELQVDNGSGLSRTAQISALSLARILLVGWESRFMPEFVASLPLAAIDGTLRKRFKKSDLEGHIHMKTGLLNNVRTIAGYMQTRSGRRLVVVALQNYSGVQNGGGTGVQDALLKWLFEQ